MFHGRAPKNASSYAKKDEKNHRWKWEKIETQIHPLSYENKIAAAAMLENGLPQSYAQTLETGIWDNCEILPEEETAQQGKALSF